MRVFVALLAAIQVSGPPAAALADGLFARDARWIGIHIESHSGGRHDHPPHLDDCFFCQFLSQHGVAPRLGIRDRVAAQYSSDPVSAPDCPCRDTTPHLPDSRAPPLA